MKITINLVLIAFITCDNIGYVNSVYAKPRVYWNLQNIMLIISLIITYYLLNNNVNNNLLFIKYYW